MATETPEAVLDVASVASLFGTTEKAIRQRVARRLLPFRKLGGRVVFVRTELEQFLTVLPGCTLEESLSNVQARNGVAR